MKINKRLISMTLSAGLSFILLLSGCTNGNVDQGIEENNIELSDETGSASDAENADDSNNGAAVEENIDNDDDGSYIFEDICKVSETYEESDDMAPIELVARELGKESYKRLVLKEHTLEEKDGKEIDTVKYRIETANPTDAAQQIIECEAVFEKDEAGWKFVKKEWTDWTVKNFLIRGSDWRFKESETLDLKNWFGKEIGDQKVFIYVNNDLTFIGGLKGDDRSVYETKVGTKFSGVIYYLDDEDLVESPFTCTEGKANDDGFLSFKLETEFGEDYFTLGEFEYFSVAYDDLDTFEVTSENLNYYEWDKKIGESFGNVSPELSWEKVDGASEYVVFMVDIDTQQFILHSYVTTDTNHLDEGAYDKDTGYFGPRPTSPHEYAVYVFALKEKPNDLGYAVPSSISNIGKMVEVLLRDKPDNIISYGKIKGSYEYFVKVW